MNNYDLERFISKIKFTDTCWLWVAAKDTKGYGRFSYEGKNQRAHRVAYGWWVGPIKNTLDHFMCRNKHCVRPEHLEDVSYAENTYRANGSTLTHCSAGHARVKHEIVSPGGYKYCYLCKLNQGRNYDRFTRVRGY